MSILGRYLDWFGDQDAAVQIGSTVVLFALLFTSGIYTAGIAPGAVLVLVLVDHWLRGQASTDD